MVWYKKEAATPIDKAEIGGLFFLDGDLWSRITGSRWTVGMKSTMIAFDSGVACEVWGIGEDKQKMILHLFGEMDLLLFTDRDAGFRQAFAIAEQVAYGVKKIGDTQLEVVGHDLDEHFIVTFDNALKRVVDVGVAKRPSVASRPALLDQESRAKLPKLYHGEESGLGIDAVAQVKFFTPDSNWTWYASEFDGQDLFFGLVIGFEIELGYFSLSELTDVRGPFGLSVERDTFYQPKTLRELQAQHRKERGE